MTSSVKLNSMFHGYVCVLVCLFASGCCYFLFDLISEFTKLSREPKENKRSVVKACGSSVLLAIFYHLHEDDKIVVLCSTFGVNLDTFSLSHSV